MLRLLTTIASRLAMFNIGHRSTSGGFAISPAGEKQHNAHITKKRPDQEIGRGGREKRLRETPKHSPGARECPRRVTPFCRRARKECVSARGKCRATACTCSEAVDHCSTPCEHVLRDCGSLLRTVRARAPRPWSIAAHVNYSVTTTFPVVSRDSSARCASAI